MPGAEKPEDRVRDYYNRNTRRFLRFGSTSQTRAIHQPLYIHPEYNLRQALEAPYRFIAGNLGDFGEESLLLCDLGCGVGDGMLSLLQNGLKSTDRITGITISGHQAALARTMLEDSGFGGMSQVICGSFQEASSYISNIHLAYAIESFIHSPDMAKLLGEVSNILRPGGKLIVYDDFLSRTSADGSEDRILNDFRNGWQANSLYTADEIGEMARGTGLSLKSSIDHSGALKLNRVKDKLVRLAVPFARPFLGRNAYATFLVGGNARQQAYSAGLLRYLQLTFVRT